MKKIYHLSTCSTCQRIIKELKIDNSFEMQDIKAQAITEQQLDKLAELAGSYEALFSKIAMKYRAWGLNTKELTEQDYRSYILQEYTFLKRPVIQIGKELFIGNSKKTIEQVKNKLSE